VRPTGYLENYGQFKPGQYVERFWSNPDRIAQGQYRRIVIGKIESRVADSAKVTGAQACNWLRCAIFRGDPSIEHLAFRAETGNKARLELAITEMTPGSAFGRIMAGELGVGHAWVQVE
jgi:hypothetical protein